MVSSVFYIQFYVKIPAWQLSLKLLGSLGVSVMSYLSQPGNAPRGYTYY